MKRVGITQRVEIVQSYSERRDCLDQKWAELVLMLDLIPIPLPNIAPAQIPDLLDALKLDALLLSGGNSISYLDQEACDSAPERDDFEDYLIKYAIKQDLPIIGVCRGMQMINYSLGGSLVAIDGHIAVKHEISILNKKSELPDHVNSYHNWGIPKTGLAGGLRPLATDGDGNIEAFEHEEKNILGIMWHPERETPFSNLDLKLMKSRFK
ncbi:MAG: peptidase C26 [Proteobacteria bacterium]|nr:peptidase C26 [Pseudomonadota bacterium]